MKSNYWYAVQVKYGKEQELAEEIERNLEIGQVYCPTYMVNRKPSRHVKKAIAVQVPLFPKWLFVKFGSPFQLWNRVTGVRGVEGFLAIGGSPLPIRPSVIAQLKSDCATGAFNDRGIEGEIKKGDAIKISAEFFRETPWAGFSGVFEGLTTSRNAVIELMLFGRDTRVEIPAKLIERLRK